MAGEGNLDFFDISNFWLNFASGLQSCELYADIHLVSSGMPLTELYVQISYFKGEDDLSDITLSRIEIMFDSRNVRSQSIVTCTLQYILDLDKVSTIQVLVNKKADKLSCSLDINVTVYISGDISRFYRRFST